MRSFSDPSDTSHLPVRRSSAETKGGRRIDAYILMRCSRPSAWRSQADGRCSRPSAWLVKVGVLAVLFAQPISKTRAGIVSYVGFSTYGENPFAFRKWATWNEFVTCFRVRLVVGISGEEGASPLFALGCKDANCCISFENCARDSREFAYAWRRSFRNPLH